MKTLQKALILFQYWHNIIKIFSEMGDFRVWSSQISWKSNAEENQGCRSAVLIFHLRPRLYGFIMLHHLSCAYCVLWTFAKYVQILFKSISFDPFAGWHCLAKCVHGHNQHYHHHHHHHHHHCDHCLAKCVHVIKTGCRPLSLSLPACWHTCTRWSAAKSQ